MFRRRGSRCGWERGASLVEFAFILPLLILLFAGLIDFGRWISASETISSSAREGARFGSAVGDTDAAVPQYLDCDEIRVAATGVGGVISLTATDITVAYDEGPGTGTNQTCDIGTDGPNPTTISTGDRIVVTTSAELTLITPFVSNLFGGSVTITSTDRRTIFKG